MSDDVSAEDITLITRLGATDEQRRSEAARQLELKGLNTVEGLLAILSTERRRRQKLWELLQVGWYAGFFVLCVLQYLGTKHPPSFGWTLFFLFVTGLLTSVIRYNLYRPFDRGMAGHSRLW